MSMSDCIKCWDTPCSCGWDYRHKSKSRRLELASVVLGVDATVLSEKLGDFVPEEHPMTKEA